MKPLKGEFHLLDGATGTELNRRGVDTGLPLWSANALTNDIGLKNVAGADCGWLLRHHTGACSRTQSSQKPLRSDDRIPTTP
jgi:hypothetical protein